MYSYHKSKAQVADYILHKMLDNLVLMPCLAPSAQVTVAYYTLLMMDQLGAGTVYGHVYGI